MTSTHSFRPPAASRCSAAPGKSAGNPAAKPTDAAGKSAGKAAGTTAGKPAGKAAGATAGVPAGSLVRVERSEGRGHILVSTSAVSPGQVVLAEYPCVTGNSNTHYSEKAPTYKYYHRLIVESTHQNFHTLQSILIEYKYLRHCI